MAEPDATQIAAWGGGATLIAAGIYRVIKIIRGDLRADRAEALAEALRKQMAEANAELTKRADVFAGERNAALVAAAKLEASEEHHLAEIERLKAENATLKAEVERLKAAADPQLKLIPEM